MISTKFDAYTSDEKVEKSTRKLNIHHRACTGYLIYLLSTRVGFISAVHKLEKFASNQGKVNYEGLVYLLKYIRYNNSLGLKYYTDMKDTTVSDLLIQASIKTENQSMAFSDYS